jgi:acetyl-CoA carboxylase biotin carboxylase subunit
MVTGQDLVKLQIRIAEGEPLPFRQDDLRQQGHAIECRVYAEDPEHNFLPSPGRILALRVPGGPGLRDDSGVYEGFTVPIHYDPLVSKLVAHGKDREEALRRMRRAVEEYRILGIKTTLPFFERVLRDPAFCAGDFDTGYVVRFLAAPATGAAEAPWEIAVVAAALRAFQERQAARLDGAPGASGPVSGWRTAGWRDLLGRGQ